VHVTFAWGPWQAAAAATAPAAPATLVLTFAGPDGAVHQTVAYARGELRLPDLREGAWSARGDGLGPEGQVRWTAPPVPFTVRDGAATDVKLVFRPVAW
jgi:hypothetical protein